MQYTVISYPEQHNLDSAQVVTQVLAAGGTRTEKTRLFCTTQTPKYVINVVITCCNHTTILRISPPLHPSQRGGRFAI
jgi:hypothetical protein